MKTQRRLNSWISCPKPNPQAKYKLFCFPCAGGTTAAYSQWHKYLSTDIEINLVQLPGRGYLIAEKPFTELLSLVETLTSKIKPFLDKPFIFFGHSMGAILAFEIARQLRREAHSLPTSLFAAGCPAPQKPIKKPFIHKLPEAEFISELQYRYNAIPQSILQNQELKQLFLSCLRADFTMIETYKYIKKNALDCPITVFGGLQDRAISINTLERWRVETNNTFYLEMVRGNHFFLHDEQLLFLQFLNIQLSKQLKLNHLNTLL